MAFICNGVFAVAQGIPQLDGTVARARDDLSVIGREGDGEDIVVVTDEATSCCTGRELPKAEGLVPGCGECVGTIGGNDLLLSAKFLEDTS